MKNKIKTAFILSAGKGTRMKNVIDYPKSMIMINKKSIIQRILESLDDYGIKKVVINTYFKSYELKDHIRSLDIWQKMDIKFSDEKEPLETAGGIINGLNLIDEDNFFILNSDVITIPKRNSSFYILEKNWHPQKMEQLLLLIDKNRANGYRGKGDFNLTQDYQITNYGDNLNYVFMGSQIISKKFFDGIKLDKISFPEIWQLRTNKADEIIDKVYGIEFDGNWIHVGDPESFEDSNDLFNRLAYISSC